LCWLQAVLLPCSGRQDLIRPPKRGSFGYGAIDKPSPASTASLPRLSWSQGGRMSDRARRWLSLLFPALQMRHLARGDAVLRQRAPPGAGAVEAVLSRSCIFSSHRSQMFKRGCAGSASVTQRVDLLSTLRFLAMIRVTDSRRRSGGRRALQPLSY